MLAKLRYLAIILVILSAASASAYVEPRYADRITCVQEDKHAIMKNISTVGLYSYIADNFRLMPNLKDDQNNGTDHCRGGPREESLPSYDGELTFCYNPTCTWRRLFQQGHGDDCYCDGTFGGQSRKTLKKGQSSYVGGTFFRVAGVGDKLCVQALFVPWGWMSIGCQFRKHPVIADGFQQEQYQCRLAESCINAASRNSKNIIPISALAVQCVKQTLDVIFNDQACLNGDVNYLGKIQDGLRQTVMLVLVLYFTVLGYKMMLAGDLPRRGEVMMYIAKAILVIYFSVGFPTVNSSGDYSHEHGVSGLYDFALTASSAFSNMVFDVTGSRGLCDYSGEEYGEFDYLRIWDAIDCRLMFYLGMGLEFIAKAVAAAGGVATAAVGGPLVAGPAIFLLVVPAIFSGELIFVLLLVSLAFLLIGTILYIANVFIVSMFAITLAVLMAPIFVPMMLFEQTKQFFESWRSVVIGFTIQPMIITAFVGMMFVTLDSLYFRDCEFTSTSISGFKFFYIKDNMSSEAKKSCDQSLGGKFSLINNPEGAKQFHKKNFIFFETSVLRNPAQWRESYADILKIILFMLLFKVMSKQVEGIAQELSGNAPSVSGMAKFSSATSLADRKEKADQDRAREDYQEAKSAPKSPGDADGSGGGGSGSSGSAGSTTSRPPITTGGGGT